MRAAGLFAAILILLAVAALVGRNRTESGTRTTAPSASRGATALAEFGCGACHTIPGITGAHGGVGPPLDDLRDRAVIAGRLPNGTTTLVRWIMHPQAIVPGNAMPELGVPDAAARDMAAYLLRPAR
jgi:cytochrome c